MTDFTEVRIPATRAGSGIERRVTPSGREEQGQRVGGAGVQRMRRHIDKGTTDLWPVLPPGSETVNNLSSWGASDNKLVNVISGNTSGVAIVNTLCPPNAVGQILVLVLDDQTSGASSIFWDTSGCLSAVRSIIDGSSTYSMIELDDEGDNVILLAVSKGGSLYWYLLDNNGAVLS